MVKRTEGAGRATLLGVTKSLANSKVKVGILSGSGTHPDSGMSYASLMYLQEVKGVRSKDGYIRRRAFEITSRMHGQQLVKQTLKKIKAAYTSGVSGDEALSVFGRGLSEAIKETFGNPSILPSNAPSTISAKGANTPLVDTGALRDKITFKVIRST